MGAWGSAERRVKQMSTEYTKPPYPGQMQGSTKQMRPLPHRGERSYRGSGGQAGMRAWITSGDSGIGRGLPLLSPGKERMLPFLT